MALRGVMALKILSKEKPVHDCHGKIGKLGVNTYALTCLKTYNYYNKYAADILFLDN